MRGLIHFLIQASFSLTILYCLLYSAGIRKDQILGFFNSQIIEAETSQPATSNLEKQPGNSDLQASSEAGMVNETGTDFSETSGNTQIDAEMSEPDPMTASETAAPDESTNDSEVESGI